MKANDTKTSKPSNEDVSAEHTAEANFRRLGAFFELLLGIDKRNHPEKYDYQKHRDSADQTTPGTDWDCPSRI
jgi:hypothetical protein